jgi:hypothetical protein
MKSDKVELIIQELLISVLVFIKEYEAKGNGMDSRQSI